MSEKRQALLTFVIGGGGPTGVELAGAIAEIAHGALRSDFHQINPTEAKICQNNPTSVPPLLKKGLIINSQVSLTTLVGLGRGASGSTAYGTAEHVALLSIISEVPDSFNASESSPQWEAVFKTP